jgi:hypothetical protein
MYVEIQKGEGRWVKGARTKRDGEQDKRMNERIGKERREDMTKIKIKSRRIV